MVANETRTVYSTWLRGKKNCYVVMISLYPMCLNGSTMATMWNGATDFLANCHRQFVKGGPL